MTNVDFRCWPRGLPDCAMPVRCSPITDYSAVVNQSLLPLRRAIMAGKLGQHAIVVGASIAGLIAARVLAEHFDEVTAIDQDELSDRPVIHKSVPQGHHLHAMLPGGIRVLSSLYPAFTEELVRRGATRVTLGRDIVWYLPDGKAYNPTGSIRTPFDSGLAGYCASRGLIE